MQGEQRRRENTPHAAGNKEGGKKKSETKKSSTSMPNKTNKSDDKASKGTKTPKTKTPQAGGKGGGLRIQSKSRVNEQDATKREGEEEGRPKKEEE